MTQTLLGVRWGKSCQQAKHRHEDRLHDAQTFDQTAMFLCKLLVSFFFFVRKYFPTTCILAYPCTSQRLDCIKDGHDQVFYLRYIQPTVLMGYGIPR